MYEDQFMQEGCIVELLCRFIVVDRKLKVEEVKTFDRARVPRVNLEGTPISTRSFRSIITTKSTSPNNTLWSRK